MRIRHTLLLGLLLVAVAAAACSPKSTAVPTSRPAATATPTMGKIPVGFTEDGLPYRGNPNALVTMVEHSEFQ